MQFQLRWAERAQEDLRSLDKRLAERIVEKVEAYVKMPQPMKFAKSLSGSLEGLYRFRIGDYRAVFQKDQNGTIQVLVILRVSHRRDIYH